MPIRLGANLIKTLMLGTVPVQKVFHGTKQIWANEVVIALGNTTTNVVLKSLFTAAEWGDVNLKKRVIINPGVNIGSTQGAYAIAATISADGQAGSWAGDLTLDVYGTISGIGGAANSGKGGDAIWANFPGRAGQKMVVNYYTGGIIRAGGGGGGRGGVGGGGVWYNSYTFREPASGSLHSLGGSGYFYSSNHESTPKYVYWGGSVGPWVTFASHSTGGWTYYPDLGRYDSGSQTYGIYRTQPRSDPVYTSGGAGGNGGRGQGYDGANAGGSAGAAGGTNAGAGGTGGTGAGWGGTGNTGNTGGAGNNGGGLAGAAGGLAGFYINGIANVTLNNLGGTLQGRVA